MATKLEVLSKEFIKPSSPTPQNLKQHQFSFLDQVQLPAYMPLIFFYQNDSSSPNSTSEEDKSHISQRLKQSLSDALTKYYPLAGRIIGNLCVDCNDSGALFIEAKVVDNSAFLSQDLIKKVPTEELCKSYLPLAHFEVLDHSIPLAVQISLFPCGGVAIGAEMSHQVGDVLSFVTFLKSWAAICRGDFEMMKPNLDLRLHYFPLIQSPKPPSREVIENLKKEKIVAKSFLFHKEKLAELKELACSSPARSKPMENPTRVEVVSAFISKKLINITKIKAEPRKSFAISHVVNLRPRLIRQQQELDNQFLFGNFSSISPPASALMMFDPNDPDFSELTSAVQSVTRKFNNENEDNIRNKMMDANQQIGNIDGNPDFEYCHFTSWCKFPLYQVDYGWGKPCLIRTKDVPYKNIVILMDSKSGDGIEALVHLADEDFAMLTDDFALLANN